MICSQPQLGFPSFSSIVKTAVNPIAMTKKSYQATKAITKKSAAVTAQVAKTGAKVVYKASVLPLQYTLIKPTQWLADKATKPIRNRVQTIVNRRAAKIAMDKRHSTTPTPAEKAEAKAWTKHKLTYDGPGGIPTPHGKILALFAGSEYHVPTYTQMGQLGVAPAVIAAAVPVFVALANAMISKYAKSGEAPANPQADQYTSSTDPVAPGTVDLQPVQNMVDEATASANQDAGGSGMEPGMPSDDGSGGSAVKRGGGLPGGISKNHLLIGAAVIGGVVLIATLTKKS